MRLATWNCRSGSLAKWAALEAAGATVRRPFEPLLEVERAKRGCRAALRVARLSEPAAGAGESLAG